MKSIGKVAAVCLAVLLLASVTLAEDIVKMKDGTTKKGKIVEETKTHVTIEKFGTRFKIARDKIKEIVKGVKSPKEEYRQRYRKIDRKDPLDLLDLADWCTENGLTREAKRLYQRVIKLEPDNDEAREALGHRKVEGKWMTKEEYKEHKAKQAAEKATGLRGEKPEEPQSSGPSAEGVAGRAKQMLAANRAESKKLAQEMIDEIGLDEVTVAITDHYLLAGQITQEVIDQLAVLAEQVYAEMSARFNHAPDFDLYKSLRRKHIMLFFKNRSDYSDGYDFAAKKWAPGLMRSKSFAMTAASFGSSGILFDISRSLQNLKGNVANNAAQDFTARHVQGSTKEGQENGRYLAWLTESMGGWSELRKTGQYRFNRTTRTVYNPQTEIANKRSEVGQKLLVKEWATGKIKKATYSRTLRTMMMMKLNRLNNIDLAIGWALVEYCTREHMAAYKKFLILIRRKPYVEAWQEAFGIALVPAFEQKFKEWVKANY